MLHFTPARRALSLVVALLFTFGRPFPASAQTVVEGSVSDAAGKPVAGVAVLVSAPAARASAQTDSSGRFRIEGLPPGTYAIDVRAARFEPYAGRIEVGEQTPPLQIVLSVSMPSLRVIGSVVSHPRTTFNDTPAAVKIFPREAYRDQGQPNLASVLAQTPGSAVSFAQSQNASIAGISSAPVVRASLPFETAVSIDGVAVSLPSDGAFDASLLPSSVLADVEIGKGPGDVAGIAPNAIAGSLNLRTTDPTATRRALFEFSSDDRGGAFSDFAYGGTMPGDKVAFAAVITTDGAIGPLTASSFPLSLSEGTIVNGH
ncbi:MAG TPA: TonB-dependent receptor, partial [Candidatus Aquilonibacter sp.]